MRIELTPQEYVWAAYAGFMRQASNVVKNLPSARGGADIAHGYDGHIIGAVGEFVVAKALELFWPGPGRLKGDDVGNLQVRAGAQEHYRLIVHPSDDDGAAFVLVTGGPLLFAVRGWLRGAECKRPEWWADPKGGRPAFFVPQNSLHPLTELLKQDVSR